MQQLTGIVLIIGSLLFIIAAFSPISSRVFPERDSQKRVDTIKSDRRGWLIANLLFGLGALVAVVGLGMVALDVQTISQDNMVKMGMILGAATAAIGAILWLIITYNRVSRSPEELFGNTNVYLWMFPAYTILTQIALMIFGLVLVQTGYPAWLGWGLLGLAALSLVAFLILKDMPPFTHYVLLLIVGIMLAR